jgi:hypothetical protein
MAAREHYFKQMRQNLSDSNCQSELSPPNAFGYTNAPAHDGGFRQASQVINETQSAAE